MAAQASSKKEQRHLKKQALRSNDIVESEVRLCVMNLCLYGTGDECPISANDALAKEVGVTAALAAAAGDHKEYRKIREKQRG